MEPLYAEAVYCTAGEERAQALLESVRRMAEEEKEGDKWLTLAESLCQQAVFELQTRAVEVDERIEVGDTTERPPYTCQPLKTLEMLETNFRFLNSSEDMCPRFDDAIFKGDAVWVDLFILGGVDPSANANRAIRWASEIGHLPIVKRLLQDARVDPSASNNRVIQLASKNGHLAIVNRLLQDARVDPSASGNWAIRWASGHGHLPIVNRLLQDARVDPSACDNSAILWAYRYKKLPVVKRLLQDERVTSSLKTYLLEVYTRSVQ